jgi:predicted dithiol-disulfide oxidoreductase (DUF899 family)
MNDAHVPHPPIATRAEWRSARKALLEEEKALTRARDRVNALRRRLPMVPVEKTYEFTAPEGRVTLLDLFEGRRQLIVYHFMFDPSWDEGCDGCTAVVDGFGRRRLLAERDTAMVLVSRAPLAKLAHYRHARGWDLRWVSSHDSDFNYDFHATLDAAVAPVEFNYLDAPEIEARGLAELAQGENHGLSVFFRLGDRLFHTYSTFARGVEGLTDAYSLLDTTPYGRQQDFEDSPPGWPQRPTYG